MDKKIEHTKAKLNTEFVPTNRLVSQSALSSVGAFFGRTIKGDSAIQTTGFGKGEEVETLLEEWSAYLHQEIEREWPTLVNFEDDLAKKVGPLSYRVPWSERYSSLADYYTDSQFSEQPINNQVLRRVDLEFGGSAGLRMRNENTTMQLMKKSTSSGLPFFEKRKAVMHHNLLIPESVVNVPSTSMFSVSYVGMDESFIAAAMPGWRGQEGGPSIKDVKQRMIWMFPASINLEELRIYQPLIESFQSLGTVPPWVSNSAVDARITGLFNSKGADDLIVCSDFSKFDQHFNPDMQNIAKEVLIGILANDAINEWWLETIFPIKYQIPMVLPNPRIKRASNLEVTIGTHGMASGSGGTNADETLAHRYLQHECAFMRGQELNPNSMCLGDDGILSFPGIRVEDVIRSYTSHGQEMNESKQYASPNDCVFLRRWHHKDYLYNGLNVGVYSTCRALGKLYYTERFIGGMTPVEYVLRELSIVENCNTHPLFFDFIEFVMQHSKYRLGLDLHDGLERIVKYGDRLSKEDLEDYIGYNAANMSQRTSIRNWAVVQYLMNH